MSCVVSACFCFVSYLFSIIWMKLIKIFSATDFPDNLDSSCKKTLILALYEIKNQFSFQVHLCWTVHSFIIKMNQLLDTFSVT
jgi:hypothetical protein